MKTFNKRELDIIAKINELDTTTKSVINNCNLPLPGVISYLLSAYKKFPKWAMAYSYWTLNVNWSGNMKLQNVTNRDVKKFKERDEDTRLKLMEKLHVDELDWDTPIEACYWGIWNIPAVITCPFRTPQCEELCYARKAERKYPDVLPCRTKNYKATKQDDFVVRMCFTIHRELLSHKYKNTKFIFRIHESGDFYNNKYADKWLQIINYCEQNIDIQFDFECYTKSLPYFEGKVLPRSFKKLNSLWADTKPELAELSYKGKVYTALPQSDVDAMLASGRITEDNICHCAGCGSICDKCQNTNINELIVVIH